MTIREHFEQMNARYKFLCVAVAAIVACTWQWLFPKTNILVGALLVAAVLLGFTLPISYLMFRCPRCGGSYQRMSKRQPGRDLRMYWDKWSECPDCKLSFDAPWSKPHEAGK